MQQLQQFFSSLDSQQVITVLATMSAALFGGTALTFASRAMRAVVSQVVIATSLLVISGLVLVGWAGYRLHANSRFSNNFESYVAAAFKSSEPAKAQKYLERAKTYLETNDATEGFTSCLYDSQEDDLGELYVAISDVCAMFAQPPSNNRWWREAMHDKGIVRGNVQDGKIEAKVPSGISVYPFNVQLNAAAWVSFFTGILSAVWRFLIVFVKANVAAQIGAQA